MTAALFLVADLLDQLSSNPHEVVLTGTEAHHAAAVRRIEVGEAVLVGDGDGTVVTATAVAVDRTAVRLAVTERRLVAEPQPRLVVVQALAKGDRSELAVELMTELGVDEIVPWAAERSVAQWRAEKVARGVERWRRTSWEAAKQSRRSRVPRVAGLADTAEVCRLITASGSALVLHEDAVEALATTSLPGAGAVLLVIGPEGGISDPERRAFSGAGAVEVRLGPEVLRTSTAGAAALAALSLRTGRWSAGDGERTS